MNLNFREDQFKRLVDVFGEKAFSFERMKRIKQHTEAMPDREIKNMVNYFIDNNTYAPKPRDFEVYALNKGFKTKRKKPESFCSACKNRGHFVGIAHNGYKFMFDCPEFCEWNKFYHGTGPKKPWGSHCREKGFKLEHEVRGKVDMTSTLANAIKLNIIELSKKFFKGTGYDKILEDYQKNPLPRRDDELSPAGDVFKSKAESSDDLPF